MSTMKIEINQATYDKLMLMNGVSISLGVIEFGSIDKYVDYLVNMLIKDHEEVQKCIQRCINKANGKCITRTILGHAVIANHHFDSDNICKKCGIQTPEIMTKHDCMVIEVK